MGSFLFFSLAFHFKFAISSIMLFNLLNTENVLFLKCLLFGVNLHYLTWSQAGDLLQLLLLFQFDDKLVALHFD